MVLVPKPLEVVTPEQNTLVTQEKEYSQTKSEWAADNRERVIHYFAGNSTYTVPDGKRLYITCAHMSTQNLTAGAAAESCYMRVGNDANKLILSCKHRAQNDNGHISISFPMPIKVNGGDTVNIAATAGMGVTGSFIGYLE